ncbi:MAG: S1C family serine protease [Flavobacteriales bacterium]
MIFSRPLSKKKGLFFAISLSLLFQSCVSIFKTSTQKDVELTTEGNDRDTRITVMNKPDTGKGSLTLNLERKHQAYQAVLMKDGYKNAYRAVYSDKFSAMTAVLIALDVPFIPFIVPIFVEGSGGTFKKYCDYEDPFRMKPPQVKIPEKQEAQKYLYHGSTSFDIQEDDTVTVEYQRPSDYREGKEPEEVQYSSQDLTAENLIFNSDINDLLVQLGYRDTVKEEKGLSLNNYNSVKLKSTIERFHVRMYKKQQSYFTAELTVNWTLNDNYGEKLYDTTITKKSGQFARDVTAFDFYESSESASREESMDNVKEASLKRFKLATLDALKASLISLVQNPEVQELMEKGAVQKEKKEMASMSTLRIPKPSAPEKDNMNEQMKGVVTIKKGKGHGSGCIISSDGYILTNYHVISGQDSLEVLFGTDTRKTGVLQRKSKVSDLALLKVDTSGLNPLRMKTDEQIDIGSDVMAIGTPEELQLGQSLTKGIISGKRELNNVKYIQTDVSINAGNSGGALIEKASGEVIGIVTAKMFGIGVEGIGFAVPSYKALEKLKIEYK